MSADNQESWHERLWPACSGAILAVRDANNTPGNPNDDLHYVYLYDGNGNVGQVVDPNAPSATASLKAKYEYDPYGRATLETGTFASRRAAGPAPAP